jgi:hypothetical protein
MPIFMQRSWSFDRPFNTLNSNSLPHDDPSGTDVKDDMLQRLRGIEAQLKRLLISAVDLEGGERKARRLAALKALEAKLKTVTAQ